MRHEELSLGKWHAVAEDNNAVDALGEVRKRHLNVLLLFGGCEGLVQLHIAVVHYHAAEVGCGRKVVANADVDIAIGLLRRQRNALFFYLGQVEFAGLFLAVLVAGHRYFGAIFYSALRCQCKTAHAE